jgi:Protein of unknown function (DUF3455)
MNHCATLARRGGTRLTPLRMVYAVGAVTLSLTLTVSQPRLAAADPKGVIVVPAVPANLEVPAGNQVYLEGLGVGTQDYICLPCPNAITPATMCPASGFAWAFYAPQATLFDVDVGHDKQIITHFLSPNPAEGGTLRPTWQHSRDTSTVWVNNSVPPARSSTDQAFVAAGAIPWLLLPVAGTQGGPTGSDTLTKTTFIQRLNTSGGVAPAASTCATTTDIGKKALVPYSADYFFYKASN